MPALARAGRPSGRQLLLAALAALVLNAVLFAVAALLSRERPLRFEMSEPVSVNLITLKPPAPPAPEERATPEPRPEPEPRQDFLPAPTLPSPARPDLPTLTFDLEPGLMSLEPARGEFIFNAEDLDQPPREVARTVPLYPFKARQRGIEGALQVKFLVGVDGRVSRIEIVSAEPEGVFEDAVLQTIPSWRFEPGRLGGRAVPAWVLTPITFELDR